MSICRAVACVSLLSISPALWERADAGSHFKRPFPAAAYDPSGDGKGGGEKGGKDGSIQTVKVTLLKVWASRKDKPDDLPKELKEHEKLLKEATQKNACNNFRLDEKPVEKSMPAGEKGEFKLPKESTLAVTPCQEKARNQKDSQWALKCQLDDLAPVKIRQSRSPILTKLKAGNEQLVLILLYEPAQK